jgi:hypothetical protein
MSAAEKLSKRLYGNFHPSQMRGDRLHACTVNWRSQFREILSCSKLNPFARLIAVASLVVSLAHQAPVQEYFSLLSLVELDRLASSCSGLVRLAVRQHDMLPL